MKKHFLLSVIALLTFTVSFAQIRLNNTNDITIAVNSSAFIDASSNVTENAIPNMGKGLLFPRTDLSKFTSFSGRGIGAATSYPGRYDGFIVYNTATSGVAGVGATEGGSLSKGFWYYDNPTPKGGGSRPAFTNAGTWRRIKTTNTTDGDAWAVTGEDTASAIGRAGNVGIGTTAPTNKLTINADIAHDSGFNYSTAQQTIFDPNTNGGNSPNGTRDILHLVREGISSQSYGNKASFALGRYENNGTRSRSQLDIKLTDGSFNAHNTVMSLRSSGNVGIGTTAPTNALHVNAAENGGIAISDNANSGNNLKLGFYHGGLAGKGMAINWNDTMNNNTGGLIFQSLNNVGNAVNNLATFTRDGKFGIGTTNPTAALDINGSVKIGTLPGGSNSDQIITVNGNGELRKMSAADLSSVLVDDAWGVEGEDITSNIGRTGAVGIGTGNPTQKLEVIGQAQIGSAGEELRVGYMGHQTWAGIAHKNQATTNNYALIQHKDGETILNTPTSKNIRFRINNRDKMILTPDGKFGIGTTNPTAALDVNGGVKIATLPGGSNSDQIITVNGNGELRKVTAADLSSVLVDDAWGVEGEDITSNIGRTGSVGIGTGNPTQKLEVIGQAQIGSAGEELRVGYMGHQTWAGIAHKNQATTNNYALIQHKDGETILNTPTSKNIRFRINNRDKMILTPDGKFGIGTTSPTAALDVNGGVKIATLPGGADSDQILTVNGNGELRKVTADNLSRVISDDAWGVEGEDITSNIGRTGNVGVGTTAPTNKLTINADIVQDNRFNYSTAQQTIFDPNANGGNSPNGTRDILHLVREGVSGQAYGNKASFALGRYENNSTSSRSQLDIKLTDGRFDAHNTVMSLRSNGNVGVGITTPTKKLDVNGEVRVRSLPNGATSDNVVTVDANGNLKKINANTLKDNLGNHIATRALNLGAHQVQGADRNVNVNGIKVGNMGHGTSWLGVSNALMAKTNHYALLQNTTGTSILNSAPGRDLHLRIGNVDKMIIKPNGSIGIGLTSPEARLDVNGNVRVRSLPNGSASDNVVTVDARGNLKKVNANTLSRGDNLGNHTAVSDINLQSYRLQGRDYNANVEGVEVGQMGHGDLWKGIAHASMAKTKNYALIQSYTGTTVLNSAQNNNMHFRISNEDKMILTYGGNVGIGTNRPNDRLEVSGNIRVNNPRRGTYYWEKNTAFSILTLGHANAFTGGKIQFTGYNNNLMGSIAGYETAGNKRMVSIRAGYIDLDTGKGLHLNTDGNVGIGTTGPTKRLDVDGQARVRDLPNGQSSDMLVSVDNNGNLRKVTNNSNNGRYVIKNQTITTSRWFNLLPSNINGAVMRMTIESPSATGGTVLSNAIIYYDRTSGHNHKAFRAEWYYDGFFKYLGVGHEFGGIGAWGSGDEYYWRDNRSSRVGGRALDNTIVIFSHNNGNGIRMRTRHFWVKIVNMVIDAW